MAYWTATDQPPAQEDRDRLATSDVYVLLAGFRYGSPVRDQPDVSYTELEFDTATELGIPRLVFLISEHAQGPAALFVDHTHGARQAVFRQRLQDSGIVTANVDSPDRAETLIYDALIRLPRARSDSVPAAQVWKIPARTTTFTGRDIVLAELHTALTTSAQAVVQAMHGMAGIGKTSLAIEYAHRHAHDYDIAWWVQAEQSDLIPDQLATLAQALDLATPADPPVVAVARLLGQLRARGRWLLVFDNAEDPASVSPLLPAGGNGRVIITSRNPYWNAIGSTIEVSGFTRVESITLFQKRVPRLSAADADAIADVTGDLPLVVDQAAALLAETGWSTANYLQLVSERADEVWKERDQASGYPVSVTAAWQVTFAQLAETDPAGAQLLSIAARLAPEPLPLTVFTDHPDELPEALAEATSDPLDWARLVGRVRRRALARVGPNELLLHRVPAALLRAHSPVPEPQDGWDALAVRLLDVSVPRGSWRPATWPLWQALLPHVRVVTDPARAVDAVEVNALLDRMATYLLTRGDPHSSRAHFERAHAGYLDRLGGDDLLTLSCAINLGINLRVLGEHERARALHQDALDRFRRILGEDHSHTLGCAVNLAADLRELGELDRARSLNQATLTRYRNVLGDDHANTLTCASNLAIDLRLLGKHRQARDMDQDTLDRRRRVLGEDNLDTIASAGNLALDLRALGNQKQARQLHQNVLDRYRQMLGEDHPDTLRAAHDLGIDLLEAGHPEQARELHQRALEGRRRVLGDNHSDTLVSAEYLAADLGALGKHEQTCNLFQDVLDRYRHTLGENHPKTHRAAQNLARALYILGRGERPGM
jgi:tetratricopeptide (TPR) repeat protein